MSSATLERARAGDDRAFRELISPHLPELHLHCYRMLGSLTDADDVLQEVLIAAWRGLGRFAGRSSLRTWLYRIATNRCLNEIRAGKRRTRGEPVPPFEPPEPSRYGDVTWLQPYPDAELDQLVDAEPGPATRYQTRETLELAFIAALQRLPPRQTAALLLCDVLGFSLAEAADMLDTTSIIVKGVLQRARVSVDRHVDARTEPLDRGSPAEQNLATRFADAFMQDDIEGVVALLTDDAWLAMPPARHEYHGREAIAAFLHASQRWRAGRPLLLVPTRSNTQAAFACYLGEHHGPSAAPTGVIVLTMSGHRISGISRFLDHTLPARFRLDTQD